MAVGNGEQVDVGFADHVLIKQGSFDPLDQVLPGFGAEQHDRHVPDLMRLRQHQHFEHLVKRAVASGEEDCARRVLHEHGLADEEIAELDSEIYPIAPRKRDYTKAH